MIDYNLQESVKDVAIGVQTFMNPEHHSFSASESGFRFEENKFQENEAFPKLFKLNEKLQPWSAKKESKKKLRL